MSMCSLLLCCWKRVLLVSYSVRRESQEAEEAYRVHLEENQVKHFSHPIHFLTYLNGNLIA